MKEAWLVSWCEVPKPCLSAGAQVCTAPGAPGAGGAAPAGAAITASTARLDSNPPTRSIVHHGYPAPAGGMPVSVWIGRPEWPATVSVAVAR